jgi:proline iminopeptidase
MILETQLIDVDGATLEVGFAGSGEPVICQSHPFGAKSPEYDPIGGWENGMGRLVAINPRGVGRSSGQDPRDFTFRQHVEDLEAVRRHLGVDRWVFWDGSGGGVIGLLYAIAYPRWLSAVIVEYMGLSGRRILQDERSNLSPRYAEYTREVENIVGDDRHPAVLRALRPALVAAEWRRFRADRWVLVRDSERLIVCPDDQERTKASFEEFATTFDVEDRLAEIRVPTLLTAGRRDDVVPVDYIEQLRDGVPNARLAIFEESGHGIEPGSADFAKRQAIVRQFLADVAT